MCVHVRGLDNSKRGCGAAGTGGGVSSTQHVCLRRSARGAGTRLAGGAGMVAKAHTAGRVHPELLGGLVIEKVTQVNLVVAVEEHQVN